MSKKELKFTEIIEMIAAGEVAVGQEFYTVSDDPDNDALMCAVYAETDSRHGLVWKETELRVQLEPAVINNTWYMEVSTEEKLSLAEAIEQWRLGNKVKVVCRGIGQLCGSLYGFDELWETTELCDLDDLLFNSEYYKVPQN